jgi:hypothetical protein
MKDLFGFEIPETPLQGKKGNNTAVGLHAMLLSLHGSHPGKCKDCKHFVIKQYSKRYFKCDKSGKVDSSNPSTDWRANWQACGKFELEI